MLTIFSITNDQSTNEVIRWLESLGVTEIVRINSDKSNWDFHSLNIANKELLIKKKEKVVDLMNSRVTWYRKGTTLFREKLQFKISKHLFSDKDRNLRSNIRSELKVLSDYIHYCLESNCYSLGSNFNSSLNKFITLQLASKTGLSIPNSIIIKNKSDLEKLVTEYRNVVTKAMSDGVYLFGKGRAYYSYTERISLKELTKLPDYFFPSLIQGEIKKKYEVRSFYLEGAFYSMAILSQSDKQTETDFRKYNNEKPNRNLPYKLPFSIEEKLQNLFKMLNLNTGSVDLIVDNNDDYVFLEINPVGQFSMVSYPCNYYLENKIAKLLYERYKTKEIHSK